MLLNALHSIWGILYPYKMGTKQNSTRLAVSCPDVNGCTRFRVIFADGRAFQLWNSPLKCLLPHPTDQSSSRKLPANVTSDITVELLLHSSCAISTGIISDCLNLHLYKFRHKMFEWEILMSEIFCNGAIHLQSYFPSLETLLGRKLQTSLCLYAFWMFQCPVLWNSDQFELGI